MSHPLVQFSPDLWSLLGLPSQHIDSQLSYHFFQTASARTTSQSPDTLLEHSDRLVGHPAFDCYSCSGVRNGLCYDGAIFPGELVRAFVRALDSSLHPPLC